MAPALQTVDSALARITPHMDDASRSLGLSPQQTLARVHVPLLRRGLLTAALLVFIDVMKELPATLVMRPFNFDTLATQAYQLASDERLAEAATASLAIVVVGLLPLRAADPADRGRAARLARARAQRQPARSNTFCAVAVSGAHFAIGKDVGLERAERLERRVLHLDGRRPPATRCCRRRSRPGPSRSARYSRKRTALARFGAVLITPAPETLTCVP